VSDFVFPLVGLQTYVIYLKKFLQTGSGREWECSQLSELIGPFRRDHMLNFTVVWFGCLLWLLLNWRGDVLQSRPVLVRIFMPWWRRVCPPECLRYVKVWARNSLWMCKKSFDNLFKFYLFLTQPKTAQWNFFTVVQALMGTSCKKVVN